MWWIAASSVTAARRPCGERRGANRQRLLPNSGIYGKKEREPEVKYALGTLIIEVERARRLPETLRSLRRSAG